MDASSRDLGPLAVVVGKESRRTAWGGGASVVSPRRLGQFHDVGRGWRTIVCFAGMASIREGRRKVNCSRAGK